VLSALLVALAEMFVQLEVGILIKTAESSSHFGARFVDLDYTRLRYKKTSHYVFDVSNDIAKRAGAPGIY
jgi:hypothetical protein